VKLTSLHALCIFVILVAADAHAHAINLFVREESGTIKGSVYFTGGDPLAEAEVQIFDAEKTIGTVQTDAGGNFTYAIPAGAGKLRLEVRTQDGHRAEATLTPSYLDVPMLATRAGNSPPQAVPADGQLGAIQVALDRLEHRLWLRDVIGGIGYIFGLAGLWALWKARSGGARH